MGKEIGILAVCGGAVLLAGCQSGGLKGWSFKSQNRPVLTASQPVDGYKKTLEDGREQLQAGNLSAAVALFSLARADASTAADANNGLAVAYAKIGRFDLAERYFRAALAAEPHNEKFAANLVRLDILKADREFAVVERQAALASQREASALAAATGVAPKSNHRPAVTQVARGVVHISSPAEMGPAPAMAVVYREDSRKVQAKAPGPDPVEPAPTKVASVDERVLEKTVTYPVRFELNR